MNLKIWVRRYLPFMILLISVWLYLLAILTPKVLPYLYPRWIYTLFSQGFSALFAVIPFSFTELLLLSFPFACLYLLGKGGFLWWARKGEAGGYWRNVGRRSWKIGCYLLSFFILTAGINYHRTPLAQYAGLEVQSVQKEELMQLCLYLTDLTNNAGEHTGRNRNGQFIPDHTFSKTKKLINSAYDSLSTTYPVCKGYYPATKPLVFSHWVSYAYVMGFFFPFTFEVNINKAIPFFMIPAVIAHEQAHVRGFMREEDAEYAVFLLARYTQDTELKYSFYLSTLMRTLSVLYRVDEAMHKELVDHFSDRLICDLNSYIDFWKTYRSPVGTLSKTVNDAYLKANSQSDGVQSYGRVVDLLLADYKKTIIKKQ